VLTSGDMSSFPDLMDVMEILAGTWCGSGHVILFQAAVKWIGLCHLALKAPLSLSNGLLDSITDKARSNEVPSSSQQSVILSIGCLLQYVSNVLSALKHVSVAESRLAPEPLHFTESDLQVHEAVESDGMEDIVPDDDESTAEESVNIFFSFLIFESYSI